jgi:hypothetical protein
LIKINFTHGRRPQRGSDVAGYVIIRGQTDVKVKWREVERVVRGRFMRASPEKGKSGLRCRYVESVRGVWYSGLLHGCVM